MQSASYHEELWRSLPPGLPPAHRRLRERFLCERFAAFAPAPAVGAAEGAADEADRPDEAGRRPRALDLGCGEGHFAALLAESGAQVTAADVAAEPLRRAQASHPGLQTRLVEPEAALPFEDGAFDLVWAGEVIEHVADTQAWLSEVRRVLRSGGALLLSTPDLGPLSLLATALWPRRADAHFDPRSDHLRFYTRRTLAALLADMGFIDVEVEGAGGVPGARAVLLAYARRGRF